MIFKVRFVEDTGYDYYKLVYIVVADSEEAAIEEATKEFWSHAKGETCIHGTPTAERLSENGVLYKHTDFEH